MQTSKEDILTYLKELKTQFAAEGIETFALFGSFAKNTNSIYSDIGIAISKRKETHLCLAKKPSKGLR